MAMVEPSTIAPSPSMKTPSPESWMYTADAASVRPSPVPVGNFPVRRLFFPPRLSSAFLLSGVQTCIGSCSHPFFVCWDNCNGTRLKPVLKGAWQFSSRNYEQTKNPPGKIFPGRVRRYVPACQKPPKGESREGQSPFASIQSSPAACTAGTGRFLRRKIPFSRAKSLPCSFRARKFVGF